MFVVPPAKMIVAPHLIALNVPLDPLRLGSNSTRTTHPYYMARWNELLAELGIDGRVENPYWDKTKGEMASACTNKALLLKLAPHSLSCAHPANARWQGRQGRGIEHCGYCLPCLIRRAALDSAWDSTYRSRCFSTCCSVVPRRATKSSRCIASVRQKSCWITSRHTCHRHKAKSCCTGSPAVRQRQSVLLSWAATSLSMQRCWTMSDIRRWSPPFGVSALFHVGPLVSQR